MERAAAPHLSFGPPAEGRGQPPSPHGAVAVEAAVPAIRGRAGVSATRVAPHGPWPRPHHAQQTCWLPPWGAAVCSPQQTKTRPTRPPLPRACLMAEAPPALATAALPRQRGPRPGGPYGHKHLSELLEKAYSTQLWSTRTRDQSETATTPTRQPTPQTLTSRPSASSLFATTDPRLRLSHP